VYLRLNNTWKRQKLKSCTIQGASPNRNSPRPAHLSKRRLGRDDSYGRDRALAMMFETWTRKLEQETLGGGCVLPARSAMDWPARTTNLVPELFTGVKPKGIDMLIQFREDRLWRSERKSKKMVKLRRSSASTWDPPKTIRRTVTSWPVKRRKVILSRDVRWAAWEKTDPTRHFSKKLVFPNQGWGGRRTRQKVHRDRQWSWSNKRQSPCFHHRCVRELPQSRGGMKRMHKQGRSCWVYFEGTSWGGDRSDGGRGANRC
jgi:hypothetical protein